MSEERPSPPYRIETPRLIIRCWEPRDAELLKEAIDSSLEYLRPWLPWAHAEPEPLADKIDRLRRFRASFDAGEDYVYGVLTPDGSEVVGGTGLHRRVGEGALEIGYWIRESRAGQGLATEATAALARVAFEVCSAERVEIHVDPVNVRSAAIPRRLGFVEEATLRRRLPPREPGAPRADETIFSLLAEEFVASSFAAPALRAYDAVGARIL